ncbi:hypothetical protein DY000_02006894 [Brassica cretica]|uniref:OCRE domain-containing protein n=1 Tax=Brassica cretica TaxID=69181 RepID=A0ABQ7CKU2_BRACR|nr:hypothetical protein DY000_02006894 [Brassica cretica]
MLNWNSSLLLGRAFLSTVGAVCNLQSIQLYLTLIDPHTHYNPIPVKKPQTSSRRINDPGIITTCHCGAEYKTEYSASIETHTATSIDNAHQKSTDTPTEESVDSSPEDWENDYYNPTMAAYTRQNMHTEDSPSIDTQPHQRNRKRASTDIAYYPSIDVDIPTSVNRRLEFGGRAFDLFGTRKFYWEEKDEYGIYRDDQGYARDIDGHTIRVHNKDIRRLLERASRDEHSYISLPEHASSFTQTKLVPEIYTKDEINEMFY